MRWFVFVALPFLLLCGPASVTASENVDDVVRLAEAGVSDGVLLAFVNNARFMEDPTAAEIVEMQDAGVSDAVIIAMLERSAELRGLTTAEAATEPVTGTPEPVSTEPAGTATATTATEPPVAVVAPPKEDLNISYFYGSLAPYGTWVNIDDYGYCWRPNILSTVNDWSPYCQGGRWRWTDYGWYWHSDYPWGWAAFHYGRWHRSPRLGWLWSPDTTWGPAWVTWRYSDDYCGWAPLPPRTRFVAGTGLYFGGSHIGLNFNFGLGLDYYTFVPVGSFLAADCGTVRLGHSRVRGFFDRTRIYHGYTHHNRRIFNEGIAVDRITRRTGQRIAQLAIADISARPGQALRHTERIERDRLLAYRPTLADKAPVAPRAAARLYELRARAAEREQAQAERQHARELRREDQSRSRGAVIQQRHEAQAQRRESRELRRENERTQQAARQAAERARRTERETARQTAERQRRDESRARKAERQAAERAREVQREAAKRARETARQTAERQRRDESQARKAERQAADRAREVQREAARQAERARSAEQRSMLREQRREAVSGSREAARQRMEAARSAAQARQTAREAFRTERRAQMQERREAARGRREAARSMRGGGHAY